MYAERDKVVCRNGNSQLFNPCSPEPFFFPNISTKLIFYTKRPTPLLIATDQYVAIGLLFFHRYLTKYQPLTMMSPCRYNVSTVSKIKKCHFVCISKNGFLLTNQEILMYLSSLKHISFEILS